MNDDPVDELLAEATRDYNAPGTVPRDEMWARIQAARAVTTASRPAAAIPTRRGRPVLLWIGGAIAAAAVLSVGIAIGRRTSGVSPVVPSLSETPRSAVATAAAPPRATSASVDPSTSAPSTASPARVSDRDSLVHELRRETLATRARAQRLATDRATTVDVTGSADTRALAYRLVVLQHLAGSDAMITAFRAAARRGEVDAQLASWSRELLSTTRMLESSPVVSDPTMKRLLEDLDLVISQITRYVSNGGVNTEDLDAIEQSITKRGVMDKLRGTLPAGASSSGT